MAEDAQFVYGQLFSLNRPVGEPGVFSLSHVLKHSVSNGNLVFIIFWAPYFLFKIFGFQGTLVYKANFGWPFFGPNTNFFFCFCLFEP